MVKTMMGAATARQDFADTLRRVSRRGERVVLTRRNRQLAALVPIEDLAFVERGQSAKAKICRRLRQAARRMAEGGPIRRVILFGSYARGDFHDRSDIDLLVVEKGIEDRLSEILRLRRIAKSALRDLKIVDLDLILVDQKGFADWKNSYGTVQHEANRDGIVLYAR